MLLSVQVRAVSFGANLRTAALRMALIRPPRFPLSGAIERDPKPIHDPVGAIFGPKVMLINQNAGSGGDAMPWYFRKAGIGKLVGTRTWGGLVGIGGFPQLLDGGSVTAPRYAIYGLNGDW